MVAPEVSTDFFWDTSSSQGAGIYWAWEGIQVIEALPRCSLCRNDECDQASLFTHYSECTWFLNLGTITRYNSSRKLKNNRRNVIAFVGSSAVLHAGATKEGRQAFLVFDRVHVHKVLAEFRRGNTIHLNKYALHSSTSEGIFCFPYRAMWSAAPRNSCSRLFHRWLLLEDKNMQLTYVCVEHNNDLPLDCRGVNLKQAKTNTANNLHVHRLKHAYWKAGINAVIEEANRINDSQRKYWDIVHACPPLPDLVFTRKRKRQSKTKADSKYFSLVAPTQKKRNCKKDIIDLTYL